MTTPLERPRLPPVHRVLTASEWGIAERTGHFAGNAVDHQDGFIHLSSPGQVQGTLRAHFAGTAGLKLLTIDANRLPDGALVWEPSRGGRLFPHLYADLPVDAVERVDDLPVRDGTHSLPDHLQPSERGFAAG